MESIRNNIKELARCAKDPFYFISKWLVNADKNSLEKIRLLIDRIRSEERHTLLLAESTDILLEYYLWKMMFQENHLIAFIGEIDGYDVIKNLDVIYNRLPSDIFKYNSEGLIVVNSKQVVIHSSRFLKVEIKDLKGRTCSDIWLHDPNLDPSMISLPIIPGYTKLIITKSNA